LLKARQDLRTTFSGHVFVTSFEVHTRVFPRLSFSRFSGFHLRSSPLPPLVQVLLIREDVVVGCNRHNRLRIHVCSWELNPSGHLSAVCDACFFRKSSVDGLRRVHFPSRASFHFMRVQSASAWNFWAITLLDLPTSYSGPGFDFLGHSD